MKYCLERRPYTYKATSVLQELNSLSPLYFQLIVHLTQLEKLQVICQMFPKQKWTKRCFLLGGEVLVFYCQIQIINQQMLQNKNNCLKTAYSLPSSRYYRSIKYKVSSTNVSKLQNMTHVNLSHHQNVNNQTASPWRRPSSYSIRKQSKTKEFATTNIQNAEDAKTSALKISYMQTFDSLLKPIQKLREIQEKAKANRVCLPSIIDFEPSNFTSLDPLFIPFEHIERSISQLKEQLPEPKTQMSQIHHDMVIFREKIEKELDQTQQYAGKEFERLRKMLRIDKVVFQESTMKFKRNCKDLQELDEAYRRNFQGTKPRLDVLQIQIFSNRPFELARNAELDEQFPQKYF